MNKACNLERVENVLEPFRNESEYQAALAKASILIDNEQEVNSKGADQFRRLLDSLELYESKHYPIK